MLLAVTPRSARMSRIRRGVKTRYLNLKGQNIRS
jgi:hypothetical protein